MFKKNKCCKKKVDCTHCFYGKYVKSILYGGLDGIITTFAVVSSASGASLSVKILLILGLANLFADGISMGFGDYLSSRAEDEYREREVQYGIYDYETNPGKEVQKIKKICLNNEFSEEDAELLSSVIAKKKQMVIKMLLNERGINEENGLAAKRGLITFGSFLFFGFIPLISYLISPFISFMRVNLFVTASCLTAGTLFFLGALKVKLTGRNWFFSGIEIMCIGGVSAVAAYWVGSILGRFIQ